MCEFPTTNWSVIAAAASAGIAIEHSGALDQLCKAYLQPVFVFVQRSCPDSERSRDLTQSFFTYLLAHHNDLANIDPQKGRFRCWLLGAIRNFLANERRRERALKHGGDFDFISLDAVSADGCSAREPADLSTPERLFERQWALTVIQRTMDRLAREYVAKDQGERFELLRGFLVGDGPSYEALAGQLEVKPETLRVEVYRMRQRFRDLLRLEIRMAVQRSADVDDELRHLMAALSDCPRTSDGK